jgi:hypothetical protein
LYNALFEGAAEKRKYYGIFCLIMTIFFITCRRLSVTLQNSKQILLSAYENNALSVLLDKHISATNLPDLRTKQLPSRIHYYASKRYCIWRH